MTAVRYKPGVRMLAMLCVFFVTGCAATRENSIVEVPAMHTMDEFRDQHLAEVADPWETFNRSIYRFNYYFDKNLFLPVVSGYEFITPTFVQKRVSGIYNNLGEVQNITNSLFQLKGRESVTALGRFLTNSTIGLAGMFDPATSFGLKRRNEDFGQTLGYWGVDSGPYLVLPVFGPSNLRDTGGLVVDSGINYGIYTAVAPFKNTGNSAAITEGVKIGEAIDARHQQPFRYYESGYPFEYYIVRFFYQEKRNMESGRVVP